MAEEWTLQPCDCKRCGHHWVPTKERKPIVCPAKKCHSYLWDEEPKEGTVMYIKKMARLRKEARTRRKAM
jgi:hypothetical protein